jgi:predicted RNA binding protein YcfA (HicA-like mRNA interferase family)
LKAGFPDRPVLQPRASRHCLKLLRMALVKVRDLARLVEADGWKHVQTTGTMPGQPGDDVPTGTLKSAMPAIANARACPKSCLRNCR